MDTAIPLPFQGQEHMLMINQSMKIIMSRITKYRSPGSFRLDFAPIKQTVLLLLLMTMTAIGFAATSAYYLDTSRMELQVSPQTQTASGVVKVTSNSARKLRLRVIPRLWALNSEGVLVYQEPPKEGFNLAEHIGINPREFDLLPGKSRLVRFVVKTPEGVNNAEYPFQLYFEPVSLLEAGSAAETTGVQNVLDVIPVFTTTVYAYQGNPTPDVKVEKFACDFDPKKKLFHVDLNLNNQGGKHARLFGNLVVSADSGPKAHQPLDVLHMQNSTLIVVLPHTERHVENSLPPATVNKLEAGRYRMELQLVDERNAQAAVLSTCNFSVGEK
jgi:hypothetical protein